MEENKKEKAEDIELKKAVNDEYKVYKDKIDGIPVKLTVNRFVDDEMAILEEFWVDVIDDDEDTMGSIHGFRTDLRDLLDFTHLSSVLDYLSEEDCSRELQEDIMVLRKELLETVTVPGLDLINGDDPVLLFQGCEVNIKARGVLYSMLGLLWQHYPEHTSVMRWQPLIQVTGDFEYMHESNEKKKDKSNIQVLYDEFRDTITREYGGFIHKNDISGMLPGFFIHYGEQLQMFLNEMNNISVGML